MKPLVILPCDVKQVGPHPFHCVGEKYINAVAHGADTWPLLLPALGAGVDLEALTGHFDLDALLAGVDGVFLPGSTSNIEPRRYGAPDDGDPNRDLQRDALTLDLIRRVIDLEIPLFAVCRGLQELNVALGGTLHPALQEVPGLLEHREDKTAPRAGQYAPSHEVTTVPGGVLDGLLSSRTFSVNSLHGQGIRDLAPPLAVEAVASDGLVEAVSLPGHPAFLLGVQWHPEWRFREDPVSVAMFRAFGDAARARHARRTGVPV
ncbi:MAG: gamma-glutamyl-gamma-aminobutyrate hydrolase family protein [Pseudomonadales bacterium]